ncbi:thioesterase superfamily protein [Solidesulfovibrio carbinoliphilus subsp. oakridgensis]|uniref:Thioesterase superfamily protein n=1 Tax=Solidesulfovibrio carbinoliphilus subsp. oakridgensis TaxID=694327 RepID=G7Q8G3_9BACT|nr:acyl-CoA thioesterase [Solidesulfovibrio carbinoliphilus]EHJ48575.1 thioesterase superfamily protein [Solidesulfovibrio carbinoliphilus subsp. oakridgensis]
MTPSEPRSLDPKPVSASRVVMPQRMLPSDANPAGNVHGGVILKYIDTAGGIVAIRHARSAVVTASIDRMDFLKPAYIGEVVTFLASINLVGATSMEVGVRVECENPITGETRHAGSAYLTYVALDADRRPHAVPPLVLENEDDRRRNREAAARREARLHERRRERDSQRQGQSEKND